MEYYDLLEVSPNASPEILNKAYTRVMAKYHPDQYQSTDKHFAKLRTRQIALAYRVLSNPVQRQRYDRKLARQTRRPFQRRALGDSGPVSMQILRVIGLGAAIFLTLEMMIKMAHATPSTALYGMMLAIGLMSLFFWVYKNPPARSTKR